MKHNLRMDEGNQPNEFKRIVMRAFDLDPAKREVFLLCDIQGFTIGEAAFLLDINPDVVIMRLNLARRELNERFLD